jgi:hypothetical protein
MGSPRTEYPATPGAGPPLKKKGVGVEKSSIGVASGFGVMVGRKNEVGAGVLVGRGVLPR